MDRPATRPPLKVTSHCLKMFPKNLDIDIGPSLIYLPIIPKCVIKCKYQASVPGFLLSGLADNPDGRE